MGRLQGKARCLVAVLATLVWTAGCSSVLRGGPQVVSGSISKPSQRAGAVTGGKQRVRPASYQQLDAAEPGPAEPLPPDPPQAVPDGAEDGLDPFDELPGTPEPLPRLPGPTRPVPPQTPSTPVPPSAEDASRHEPTGSLRPSKLGYDTLDPPRDGYPLDLPTALRLGGARSLHIQLVRERVCEARLKLADAWFEHLAAQQELMAKCAENRVAENDTLAAVAVAYYDLVEAHGLAANARVGLAAARGMAELTAEFARRGLIAGAEVARAEAARGLFEQKAEDAQRETVVCSAELARLLRLPATITLLPCEDRVVPLQIVDEGLPVGQLIAQGLSNRPELRQYRALLAAAGKRVGQEKWRPLLPHLALGLGAGHFGGGPADRFDRQRGRSDLDALAVWELEHLGIGNHVRKKQRASQQQQTCLAYAMIRDRVAAEITTAAADVASYRKQIETTAGSIEAAKQSHRLTLLRVRAAEALPIELLQAIHAETDALDAHTAAINNYNRAQYRLLRAVGISPG